MKKKNLLLLLSLSLLAPLSSYAVIDGVETPISTIWEEQLDRTNPLPEYPRPNLVREEWQSLNGEWDFMVTESDVKTPPSKLTSKILVPYGAMSQLSGYTKRITSKNNMWYSRMIDIPKAWNGDRIMLNFDAVDWETTVWVNGKKVGHHTGGYDPFSLDITKYVTIGKPNKVEVGVNDPMSTRFISLGKQLHSLYMKAFGIWQTVWMEPVATSYIEDLKITSNINGSVAIKANIDGESAGKKIKYTIYDGSKRVAETTANAQDVAQLKIKSPKLWSPEAANLYQIHATLQDSKGQEVDKVESYTGLREYAIVERDYGQQVTLNGKDIFQYGPLDQSYWPASGMTPPADKAIEWEVNYLKSIGCNMVRMHIKQNPRRWYYHCDKAGLIVWQDYMCTVRNVDEGLSQEDSDLWFNEQERMVNTLYNYPSIAMWIVFNEGWGQHNDLEIFNKAQALDSTRLYNFASGWNDRRGVSHFSDRHDYTIFPSTTVESYDRTRAKIIGECGGISSAIATNNWYKRNNGDKGSPAMGLGKPADGSYSMDKKRVTYSQGEALTEQYGIFVEHLALLKAQGLQGAVYTQVTDMKHEENGFLTFDRKVSKIPVEDLNKIHSQLYKAAPERKILMPLQSVWKYTDVEPSSKNWYSEEFNTSDWKEGKGAFGVGKDAAEGGANSKFKGSKVYLRKEFTLDAVPTKAAVRNVIYTNMSNDDLKAMHVVSNIYINGKAAAVEATQQDIASTTTSNVILYGESAKLLRKGKNVIAIEVTTKADHKGKVEYNPEIHSSTVDYELVEIKNK